MKKPVAFILTLVITLIVFTATVAAVHDITLEGDHTVTAGQTITLSVKITNSAGTAIHAIQSTTPAISGASLDIEEIVDYTNRDITTGFLWADRTAYRDGDTFMHLKVTPDGSTSSLRIDNSVLNLQAFDDTFASVPLEDTAFIITVIPGWSSSDSSSSDGSGGGAAAPQPVPSAGTPRPAGTTVSTEATPQTPSPPPVTTAVPRKSTAPEKTAAPVSAGGILISLGALSAAVVLRRR